MAILPFYLFHGPVLQYHPTQDKRKKKKEKETHFTCPIMFDLWMTIFELIQCFKCHNLLIIVVVLYCNKVEPM